MRWADGQLASVSFFCGSVAVCSAAVVCSGGGCSYCAQTSPCSHMRGVSNALSLLCAQQWLDYYSRQRGGDRTLHIDICNRFSCLAFHYIPVILELVQYSLHFLNPTHLTFSPLIIRSMHRDNNDINFRQDTTRLGVFLAKPQLRNTLGCRHVQVLQMRTHLPHGSGKVGAIAG